MRRKEKRREEAERKKTAVRFSEEEDIDLGKAEELQEHGDESQSGVVATEDSGGSEEEELPERSSSDDDDEEQEDDKDDDEEQEHTGDAMKLQTEEDIRKELSNMPFEDVMKLQQKVGTKAFNEVAYNKKKAQEVSRKKRLNKNRPMEISAKTPPSFIRQVIPVKKPTKRDPRFDSLSGEYKPEIFEKTYKFINDLKHREKEIIKKKLKKTKSSGQRKEKLQHLLKRMENQERARQSKEQQRERELQFKKQQRERASLGERPFFLKKSEKKKLQLAEKYQELKKSGKLENFLSKKRKRNTVKDRRKLPEQLHSKKPSSR